MGWGRWSRSSLVVLGLILAAVTVEAQPAVDARWVTVGAAGTTCTVRAGSGAPSSGLGAVCDTYYRTDSPYTVYVKTGASTWSELYRQSGTDVAVADGGTGLSSWTTGDLLYASGTTTLAGIADVGAGSLLVSNSGVPGWSSSPTVSGTLTATTALSSPTLTHSANLTLSPTGDVILGPTGNDVLPSSGYTKNLGALTNKYLTLHAAELWVETLVAQETIATIGGRILVGPTTTLTADLSSGATSIQVKHNQIANGDRLVLQVAGAIEFLAVTSGASGSAGAYTYSVTRNLDGSGANAWTAGDAVFNTGTTNDGYIDLYSVNGLIAGSTAGPTIVGNVRTGTTYSDVAPRWAIGNLNGLYGYGADTYGVAMGDASNSYLTADATNGIRMIGDQGTMFSMNAAGAATFAGSVTVGMGGGNQLTNTEFLRGRDTGRATHLAGIDGTTWGGYFDETTSLTWNQGISQSGGGTCLNTNYQPRGGGSACFQATGTPNNGEYFRAWGPHMPVTAGQRVEFSYYALPYRSRVYPRIIFYDSAGVYVSESDGNVATSGTLGPTATSTAQNADIANWSRVWNISDVPSTAVIAVPVIMGQWFTGDGADPYVFYTRVLFREAQAGQTTPSPWSNGGVTLIDGDHLATDLVISNTIRSSGATDLTTGTGYFLSATSTPTFRVGNPSGNQLKWDGTNLTLGQGGVTIDSTGIYMSAHTSSVFNPATAYKFTQSGGTLGLSGSDTGGGRSLYLDATGAEPSSIALTVDNTAGAGAATMSLGSGASLRTFALTADTIDLTAATGSGMSVFGELRASGINADGTGKVVCIKSDGYLGTCGATTINTSGCTCG